MSSRALRKAQREKEEQERMKELERKAQQLEDDEQDDDDDPEPVPSTKPSAFALLGDQQEESDEAEPAIDGDEQDDHESIERAKSPSVKPTLKKRKKKRKKVSKGGQGVSTEATPPKGNELDEIDAALKALSTDGKSTHATTTVSGAGPEVEATNRLLAIDTSHLHAANEMRRLFGRTALEQDHEEQAPPGQVGGNRRQQRRAQHMGLAQALRGQRQDGRAHGLVAMALRRNIFVQGKEEWPAATVGGLAMEIEDKRADGTVLYRYVHNSAYQDVQSQFEIAVASMDPNRLINLLQHNPYHISTLLQVSEIAKQERDHATCGDLLERALFSFGRAVHSTFAKNLAEGKARMDFRRAENREFWLASWRYMQNLTMRATWGTVYEWAKLLISLSPENDPYALWLVLDQYALRSRQDLDYLNLSKNKRLRAVHHDMPNVQLSQALAEFRAGNQSKGKQQLYTAVGKYPFVITRLFQELNIDAPPAVWGKEPRSEKEKLYTELYATRAKDIWNTPETSNLLIEVASALPPETAPAPINTTEITQSEARHVLLSDTPSLIALIPRTYTTQLTSSSDPVPPDDAFMSYLSRQSGHPMTREQMESSVAELGALQRFFAQVFNRNDNPGVPTTNPANDDAELDDFANDDDDGERDDDDDNGDDDALWQRLRDAGVPMQEVAQRAQRMMHLQNQLVDELGRARDNEGFRWPPDDNDDDERADLRHARVEDAPEDTE